MNLTFLNRCCMICSIFFLALACGKKSINYTEKLQGTWQISNMTDILKEDTEGFYSKMNVDSLRTATITFKSGGKLISKLDTLIDKGTWSVSKEGTQLSMKSERVAYNELIPIEFENDRTIVLISNGKRFMFKKIAD